MGQRVQLNPMTGYNLKDSTSSGASVMFKSITVNDDAPLVSAAVSIFDTCTDGTLRVSQIR